MKVQDYIGEIIPLEIKDRDAIHVAVVPALNEVKVIRGEYVKISVVKSGEVWVVPCDKEDSLGIVDPFLENKYLPALSKFLIFVNPGTVANLRHTWDHSLIPKEGLNNLNAENESEYDESRACRGC